MKRTILPLALASLATLVAACSGDEKQPANTPAKPSGMAARSSEPKPEAKALTNEIATPAVHRAICGHALPEVGHCGNFVEIEGQWVEVLWPELGVMEWCRQGKKGAEVEITGAMKDGKFVATALKTLPAKQ
ncbi:MAG: hypothetical protein JNM84_23300 [Planctomycetes bacterium]|nr:hypothetical protein [Planctomycetota bacterium]